MINLEYATDTYSVFNFNAEEIYNQFAMSGRFITAIIGKATKIMGTPEQVVYICSYILALICVILSQYKIYKIIKDDIKSKTLKILIPILIIVNPFSIELFLFIEKGIMWFGVLASICAVEQVKKYFETNKKRNIIYAMIFMFIANCSYQGVVGIFVAISIIYILKYSSEIKEFIKNNIVVGIIYLLPAIADYMFIKLNYIEGRMNGKIIWEESILKIIKSTFNMALNTYQILPKYSFILLICFTFYCFWCKIVNGRKNKWSEIIKFLYIIFSITIITIIPQMVQATEAIWFVPRSTYTFGALYGILILYISLNYHLQKTLQIQIIVISSILLFTQMLTFVRIVNDRYKLNEMDYNISSQIIEKIRNYEESSNKKITKIEIYSDKNPKYTYDGIFATGDINVKAYMADWSTKEILEYYLKRKLEKVSTDEQNFLEKDWNEFNIDEQVILQEDTIKICNF